MLMCGGGGGEEVDPAQKAANDYVSLAASRSHALPCRPAAAPELARASE